MSKTARTNVILIIITIIVAFFAVFFAIRSDRIINNSKNNGSFGGDNVPTLYVHGMRGSTKSTSHLTKIASRDGGHKALAVFVEKDGTINYKGNLNLKTSKPLIQVIFKKKFTPVKQQTKWLHEILKRLKDHYGFNVYNAVGHSTGAVSILENVAKHNKDSDMPKLQKFVSIAGPYDGILTINDRPNNNYVNSNGKPSIMYPANKWYPAYTSLLNDCKDFPTNVQILNIYGNDNSNTNSDGIVSTSSARSMKYLISKRVKDYQEIPIFGVNGQHSKLHNNIVVDHIIARFLFDQN
ncbi:alpha/beta hydrolase [Apilactobacillus micheneri]|uniref:Alpha/beta hydrolase n=1 Tax=Apilactobacillus micheneri TaxID=1899430 RepID=A0ABY2YW85_9LACO|nr:alpha/beta hydrolase [Apilactobacillus micheneri]TPR24607.1 alpha/beta hydrolase [Apilactobacillus micheneri]TPR25918.1 alpha/beta hydrolase [Apilactobacillus micheneri]TPR28108.1 alpha/beta hydrolase [Apilactobacillus micheneri]TPR29599.1 alpha/beta hydrolase [Apilactobacillus micheneri]TPR30385.1 alpha/beta hydrolase [Apilactobacillus micheneri]